MCPCNKKSSWTPFFTQLLDAKEYRRSVQADPRPQRPELHSSPNASTKHHTCLKNPERRHTIRFHLLRTIILHPSSSMQAPPHISNHKPQSNPSSMMLIKDDSSTLRMMVESSKLRPDIVVGRFLKNHAGRKRAEALLARRMARKIVGRIIKADVKG